MNIKAILMILAALINLLFGLYIISLNKKNKNNIYYGLWCVVVSFWIFGNSLVQIVNNADFFNNIVVKFIYIPALLIPLTFLYFAYHFPYPNVTLFKTIKYSVIIPLILEFLTLFGTLNFEKIEIINGKANEIIILSDFIILTIYFVSYILFSFIILFSKYQQATGIFKNQLRFIIYGTLSTFIFGSFFSLFLPLFNNFYFDWFGTLFVVLNIVIVGYFVFIKSQPRNLEI